MDEKITNIDKIRIKTYNDVELENVNKLFENFVLLYPDVRGGYPVVHTRHTKSGDVISPASTRHPVDSESSSVGEHFKTSKNYHRESSFSTEQLPYIDLLNRLLVNIIRENLSKEIQLYVKGFEDQITNGKYRRAAVVRTAIDKSLAMMLERLCEGYPNILLVIKAFFLQQDRTGIDGLTTAIIFGIDKTNVTGPDVEKGLQDVFVAPHPFNPIKEYEVMCSGMPVAFEIASSIQDSFKMMKLDKDTIGEVSYTMGVEEPSNFGTHVEDIIRRALVNNTNRT